MEYNFKDIEKRWQKYWAQQKTFATKQDTGKPKYYVLDMFPYPSGSGLHVGHPLGYIASDIVARYKRHKGFNVLHPMGYDSFGLPAEQYAIETGQHPKITTEQNIARYRNQLDKIGLSYDWDREVRTSDPSYYKWTQWIFIQLFQSWYNKKTQRAEAIDTLLSEFEKNGNTLVQAACEETILFSAQEWNAFSDKQKSDILMNYRISYLGEAYVNWCPALGTVLANDEVKDGLSERGGHPVERKLMKQWSMRITAYAQRLLDGLEKMDWSESLKESQRYWIGRSEGTSICFSVQNTEHHIEVFTTRPDTIFGVSFIALAPEHELVEKIATSQYKTQVADYLLAAKNKSELERQAEVKKVSGQFTGAYALHPFTQKPIPIYVGDYVLVGYGTGAVMAVPGHDERDHRFATHFNLPILQVIAGKEVQTEANEAKEGNMIHSDFLNDLEVPKAIQKAIEAVELQNLGHRKINFRLRDAIFGRQRYWGEPIPIYYKEGIPHALPENELPLLLPEVDKYLPTESGDPPLARAQNWKYKNKYEYEHTTMPGWAGSSWYFLRYQDAHNPKHLADKKYMDYWRDADLYIGGSEHATGHLLYVRFWTMFLYDREMIPVDEPAKKLINQGMIQGTSCMIHRVDGENKFISAGLKSKYKTTLLHIDVNIVENNVVNLDKLKAWRSDFTEAKYELEDGKLLCEHTVEKMSKRWHNVVNPDDVCEKYGADTLRLYEMFLGPIEQSKPWNTNGITGVHGFLKKLWRLFANGVTETEPNKAELKTLHKTIKKISEDIDRFSFNTSVSNFMICVNELTDFKCNKRAILEPLLILLSPYAPHITEELWRQIGHEESIAYASFPEFIEAYLVEDVFSYPISFNGKTRFNIDMPATLSPSEIEKRVLEAEQTSRYLEGKTPKKIIIVPKKIVNIVI
ncbi:MAG: leucine--tRNA ligase [Bacteroidetes bacterium]|nr:leucine--tRNA ligase [Bacteroidota bacterium]